MTKERKDNLAIVTAVTLLVFGMVLTTIGFFVNPMGEVHNSILWILGQCLIYCGSIFGVAYYTKGVITKQIDEVERRLKKDEEKDNEVEA